MRITNALFLTFALLLTNVPVAASTSAAAASQPGGCHGNDHTFYVTRDKTVEVSISLPPPKKKTTGTRTVTLAPGFKLMRSDKPLAGTTGDTNLMHGGKNGLSSSGAQQQGTVIADNSDGKGDMTVTYTVAEDGLDAKETPAASSGGKTMSLSPPTHDPAESAKRGIVFATSDHTDIATVSEPKPAPSPTGSAPPQGSSLVTYSATVTGVTPGRTDVTIGDGADMCAYTVAVTPPAPKLVLTGGFATSQIPVQTFTSATPAPGALGAAATTQFISQGERSAGQTFIPVLFSYRLTSFLLPWNFYASAGLSTNGDSGKQVFGISGGTDDFLLTLGEHSASVDMLAPGYAPNAANPYLPGVPITYKQRTTRPFVSLSFAICKLTAIIPGLASACPSDAAPKSSPSPKSSETPAEKP